MYPLGGSSHPKRIRQNGRFQIQFNSNISTFIIHHFKESKQNVEKEDAWSIAYIMYPPLNLTLKTFMTNLKIKGCGIVINTTQNPYKFNNEIINYCSNNILLCILYHIFCIWIVNKIINIPQHRYQSYKEVNIFLIMWLKI